MSFNFHQELKWLKLSLNFLLYKYKFLNKALVISFQHSKTRNITAQYWTRQHNIYKWLGPTPKQIVWKLFTAFGQTQGGSKWDLLLPVKYSRGGLVQNSRWLNFLGHIFYLLFFTYIQYYETFKQRSFLGPTEVSKKQYRNRNKQALILGFYWS